MWPFKRGGLASLVEIKIIVEIDALLYLIGYTIYKDTLRYFTYETKICSCDKN